MRPTNTLTHGLSQSLSSRAMSFDLISFIAIVCLFSLNPFRAGRCLSTATIFNYKATIVGLNPFRAGRCLSTKFYHLLASRSIVSIPFEQGDVFRHNCPEEVVVDNTSQSLSSRAMSFDCSGMLEAGIMRPFRPTSQFFWKVKELALDLSK